MFWDGARYIARITGYEAPKLRGGALDDGKKLFVFDDSLNIIDEVNKIIVLAKEYFG